MIKFERMHKIAEKYCGCDVTLTLTTATMQVKAVAVFRNTTDGLDIVVNARKCKDSYAILMAMAHEIEHYQRRDINHPPGSEKRVQALYDKMVEEYDA